MLEPLILGIGNEVLFAAGGIFSILLLILAWMSTHVSAQRNPIRLLVWRQTEHDAESEAESGEETTERDTGNPNDFDSNEELVFTESEESDTECSEQIKIENCDDQSAELQLGTSQKATNNDLTRIQREESRAAKYRSRGHIVLKLQNFDDSSRVVHAAPDMLINHFKRKYFYNELVNQQKNVRLIFQGRELTERRTPNTTLGFRRPTTVSTVTPNNGSQNEVANVANQPIPSLGSALRLCDFAVTDNATIHCLVTNKPLQSTNSTSQSSQEVNRRRVQASVERTDTSNPYQSTVGFSQTSQSSGNGGSEESRSQSESGQRSTSTDSSISIRRRNGRNQPQQVEVRATLQPVLPSATQLQAQSNIADGDRLRRNDHLLMGPTISITAHSEDIEEIDFAGRILMPMLGLLLLIGWLVRFIYRQYFNPLSTISLFCMTLGFFLGSPLSDIFRGAPTIFLSNSAQITRARASVSRTLTLQRRENTNEAVGTASSSLDDNGMQTDAQAETRSTAENPTDVNSESSSQIQSAFVPLFAPAQPVGDVTSRNDEDGHDFTNSNVNSSVSDLGSSNSTNRTSTKINNNNDDDDVTDNAPINREELDSTKFCSSNKSQNLSSKEEEIKSSAAE